MTASRNTSHIRKQIKGCVARAYGLGYELTIEPGYDDDTPGKPLSYPGTRFIARRLETYLGPNRLPFDSIYGRQGVPGVEVSLDAVAAARRELVVAVNNADLHAVIGEPFPEVVS